MSPRNAIKKWADFYETRAKSQTDFLGKMEELQRVATDISTTEQQHDAQRFLNMFWENYNDLTATSLESWLIREIIPKWP